MEKRMRASETEKKERARNVLKEKEKKRIEQQSELRRGVPERAGRIQRGTWHSLVSQVRSDGLARSFGR